MLPTLLVGCGAVARLFYAPALLEMERRRTLRVAALCDPSENGLNALGNVFPAASRHAGLDQALGAGARLAIIASPPALHRSQAEAAFAAGLDVLCEKPLAASAADADAMVAAAHRSGRILAAGHYKRLFPSHRWIHAAITSRRLGALRSVRIAEGGRFGWPAASASFFDRRATPGGVLLDIGVHVLDLLLWWLGEPASFTYADDARGGLEANCRLSAAFDNGTTVYVRLSRDGPTPDTYLFDFEDGSVRLRVNQADRLELSLTRLPGWMNVHLHDDPGPPAPVQGGPAASNPQAFILQLADICAAVASGRPPAVPGEAGAAALRWIERCYATRSPLPEPWIDGTAQPPPG